MDNDTDLKVVCAGRTIEFMNPETGDALVLKVDNPGIANEWYPQLLRMARYAKLARRWEYHPTHIRWLKRGPYPATIEPAPPWSHIPWGGRPFLLPEKHRR